MKKKKKKQKKGWKKRGKIWTLYASLAWARAQSLLSFSPSFILFLTQFTVAYNAKTPRRHIISLSRLPDEFLSFSLCPILEGYRDYKHPNEFRPHSCPIFNGSKQHFMRLRRRSQQKNKLWQIKCRFVSTCFSDVVLELVCFKKI
jgi:hypothetical protein